jgi:Tfp pilus assembly ATPase PilU
MHDRELSELLAAMVAIKASDLFLTVGACPLAKAVIVKVVVA